MKKIIIIAALAVFGLTTIQAQDGNFGIKAGVNFANLGGDFEDTHMRTGFHGGFVGEVFTTDRGWTLGGEVLYSMQGFETENSELRLDYINLSLYAKYYIVQGLSLDFGLYYGGLASAKLDDEDVKDVFTEYDYLGILSGTTYKFASGLFFQGRYNHGLFNVLVDSDDFRATNQVIQFSVGYMF